MKNTATSPTKNELSPIHDFSGKLRQAGLIKQVKSYVLWQAARRGTYNGKASFPDQAPTSINLDLSTICNYACDHCVDKKILNTSFKFAHDKLMASLRLMAEKGLKSVIIIGGGEPTTYPKFEEFIYFLKELKLQVAVVSNGSGNRRILQCADAFTKGDWVRLSLDSGLEETFQAMHKPKLKISLDEICEWIPKIKEKNPAIMVGYSFMITWKGSEINDTSIIENIDEIETATKRARKYKFDYISLKPFLARSPVNNAEIIDYKTESVAFDEALKKTRASVNRAKAMETDTFKVWESTNLMVLENGTFEKYTRQPKTCHMQIFRQILSPLGLYNCPVYRNQPHGQLGDLDAYVDETAFTETMKSLIKLLDCFDAAEQCKEVTCLYNDVNWWLEDLINHPEKLDNVEPTRGKNDFYL
jgi:wyosine [tRNA(Phe)-imidazoG37] synthetase (radical SAM superfamily)